MSSDSNTNNELFGPLEYDEDILKNLKIKSDIDLITRNIRPLSLVEKGM
jgi:hypothetical protein